MRTFVLNFIRSFKYGFQNFGRNVFLSVATTSVMVLTLFGLGFFIVINQISNNALEALEAKVDISVYLKDGIQEFEIENFLAYVKDMEEVKEVEFKTKDQALEEFKVTYKNNPEILDSINVLDVNPLPATVNIRAINTSLYGQISENINNSPFNGTVVSKVSYDKQENKDIVERLNGIVRGTRNIGITIVAVLGIIAVLITYNTIRLTMYSYRHEIEIMRLVGASSSQIKGPFIVEGVLFGFFGTVISFLILFGLVMWLAGPVGNFIPGSDIRAFIMMQSWLIVGVQLAVGVLLGVGSSLVAINRYLRV
jgi:cell division transport system permease protein